MHPPFILAIDQGTSSSRALIVDSRGSVAGLGQQPFPQHFPHPGWVEHDLDDIWQSVERAIAEALRAAGITFGDLAAIGITNQRETVALWDRQTGEPVGHAIVWQDRRTAGLCTELRESGLEAEVARRTGLRLDPYFSGTKLTWLLQHDAGLRARCERGELAAGTIDTWLVWKLTGGRRHVTDFTNASRTLLFNIHEARWDEELCGRLGVPVRCLPEAVPSHWDFGFTDEARFGARVPIAGIAGDQQAAFFGQACTAPGLGKNTYGTGCFILGEAGDRPVVSRSGLLVSLGANSTATRREYVIEGSVFVTGAAIQWLRDELGIIERSSDVEALAASVPDSGGVVLVPGFTGLGAPYWDPHARGAILGLTRGSNRAHLARAALEAIALSSAEVIHAMDDELPVPIRELRVDGGASRNNLLMQMQADFTGIPVVRPREIETTALGAAYLAGIQAGIWAGPEEVAELWRPERVFEPIATEDERQERLARWRRAVERTLAWEVGG